MSTNFLIGKKRPHCKCNSTENTALEEEKNLSVTKKFCTEEVNANEKCFQHSYKNADNTSDVSIVSQFSKSSELNDIETNFDFVEKMSHIPKEIKINEDEEETPKSRYQVIASKNHSCFKKRTGLIGSVSCCHGCLNNEIPSKYSLPIIDNPQISSKAFESISGETLSKIMIQLSQDFFKKFILIDCRYPYEFKGGHIKGAINFYKIEDLKKEFFTNKENVLKFQNKIPIFYCEYSQKRSPSMAHALRNIDRRMNSYPTLTYKEMYILDSGYKKFFECGLYNSLCDPYGYTSMVDKDFTSELKKHNSEHNIERSKIKINLKDMRSTSLCGGITLRRRTLKFD
uniref:M-phase inducer phosphatase n=1 Tax=Parastrongyloides trichosuri TaxID=131310 RepID=A0A0N4ZB26_PARTI